ncbi:hypothetical protein ACROYT_G033755 [Oculina patagonica]
MSKILSNNVISNWNSYSAKTEAEITNRGAVMVTMHFTLSFKVGFFCLFLSASVCCGNLFGSLQFTRGALFGFSRVVANSTRKTPVVELDLGRSLGARGPAKQPQTRTIFKPSNKFLELINEIEKAVANAGATDSRLRYNNETKATLSRLLADSIKSKSYKYARDVLGKVLHLLSTDSSTRRKRSAGNKGKSFLEGLRETLGNETFDSFMAVDGDVSLIFVIDDTGSMRSVIEAVKKIAISVINFERKAPVEYILSPFNDPMSGAGQLVIKEDGEARDFVQAINALRAHSGGDCPEYTFEGMLNALGQDPLFGSPMYVFTDAGPKDATKENIEEVKLLAEGSEITINFLTTGSCRGGHIHPAFLELAEFTSGQALLLKDAAEVEKLKDAIRKALEGTTIISFGSTMSARKKRSSGGQRRYRFPVDDSMESITISVKTTRRTNGHGITLRDPTGALVTAEKVILSQVSVYQIANPVKGNWILEISGSTTGEHEFYVKSSSGTNIDFKHFFVIPIGRGRRKVEVLFPNPIAGKLNKMVLTLLAGEGKVDTGSLRLQLVTKSGAVIRNLDLVTNDSVHYETSLIPPTTPFKLKLIGTTQKGHTFERISRRKIKPTTALLRAKYASNDFTLPLNKITFLHFQICNFGATELFQIAVKKDRMGYIVHKSAGSQRPKYVAKDRCTTVFVRAKATRPADVRKTNIVTLIAKGQSSGVIVSQVIRLFVVNSEG